MKVKNALKKSPLVVRKTRDRTFIVEGRFEIAVHRKRNHKAVAPDGDVIPVAEDLFGARFKGSEVFQDRLSSVSISGLLRALSVFKILRPQEYELLVSLMKMLSYSFDRNVAVPPLYLLKSLSVKELDAIWDKVKELTGVGKDAYCTHVAKEFTERGLLESYALFYPDREEDEDALLSVMEEFAEGGEEEEEKKAPAWEKIFPGLRISDDEEV